MTPEDLTELNRKIAVMEAHRDGKEIEYRRYAYQLGWRDSADPFPAWNWAEFDYRVKVVEPRRVYGWTVPGKIDAEFIELTPEIRTKLNL